MLYIEVSYQDDKGKWSVPHLETWEVYTPFPFIAANMRAVSIQAAGEELDFILNKFDNIPRTRCAVQKWREPFSQFITDNLALSMFREEK